MGSERLKLTMSKALPAVDLQEIPWATEIAGHTAGIDAATLEQAIKRARHIGSRADEVLIAAGRMTPDDVARNAARHLSIRFEPLDRVTSNTLPPRYQDIIGILRSGLLRTQGGQLIVAARGERLEQLAEQLANRPQLANAISLTTPERLAAHVHRCFSGAIGEHAAFGLHRFLPELSAHHLGASRWVLSALALALMLLPFAMHAAAAPVLVALAFLLAFLLLGWSCLRITACLFDPPRETPPLRDDAALPTYSLLVPLYKEARIVAQLVKAMAALDYPREKLQVLFIVEEDDLETAAALSRWAGRPGFEVICVPPIGPRTKPKALNYALAFARGEIVGVFDAEDVPDPQQLRRAAAAFRRGGAGLACVQARLAIDNLADSWITRQFAADYAAHFDVILPMLAAHDLPLPLGGTSNHFRRALLERVGGWDPCNVTEDADLGIRLARQGWRTAVIASTTDEEAPRTLGAWLRQRSRWYKGWMQTILVHARHPRQLIREIGWTGATILMLMLGGNLAAALVHPFFTALLLASWWRGDGAFSSMSSAMIEGIGLAVFAIGCGAAFAATALGMRRRRLSGLWKVLPLMPAYWILLSCAAWRALFQLLSAPQHWEKTEHGLARTSRRLRGPSAPLPPPPLRAGTLTGRALQERRGAGRVRAARTAQTAPPAAKRPHR